MNDRVAEIERELRTLAADIARAGINGFGNRVADLADQLAALKGWQPIETCPKSEAGRRFPVVVFISNAGPRGYVTDPWTGWIDFDGDFVRWPHNFPPTHWMPIPTPPRTA